MPPAPGGGKKKTGLIIGAVAVVAAIAVGAYFVIGGGSGGSDVADDGPHKLTTPATVLTDYKKSDAVDSGGFDESDLKDAEKHGVKGAKDVSAGYQAGDESNPLALQMVNFMGVYGEIDDPEKVVDAMFVNMKEEAAKEPDGGEVVGSPKSHTPSGLDGAVLKCQEIKTKNDEASPDNPASGPAEVSIPVCIWGDHSTLGIIIDLDLADAMAGKAADLEGAAELTAKFRKEVRVKI
jgi:hypothetical protein